MNRFAQLSPEQLQEHLSSYLVDSWSYSKVSEFARNEKEFEKTEIYHEPSKRGASSVAGNAYHKAMELFFNCLKTSPENRANLADMTQAAYSYIDGVPANVWKLQKTTPTVENCLTVATENSTKLIENFMEYQAGIFDSIAEVLGVEHRCEQWLTVNGVDIPLPCHAQIDLVFKDKTGKIIIADHKSKASYTDDKDAPFVYAKQAITYVLCWEAETGQKVDEVWFVENKTTRNRDGSAQLKAVKITLDDDTRKLYESMLYEPLRRMIEAVGNPDYIYLTNDNDSFADIHEMYAFWAKTMIAEVDDFQIPDSKKPLIQRRLKKIKDSTIAALNPRCITEFKKNAAAFITYDLTFANMNNSEKIEHTLRTFGIVVRVAKEISGYSSNSYLLEVNAGVKIGNIMKYKLDIANALNVPSVRILQNLLVYEGKSYLAIESQKKREKDLLWDKALLQSKDRIPIGVDNFGRTVEWNLSNNSTPHMLICGATGSGKSVCIRSTIEYAKAAGFGKIIIFDPKYEFTDYNSGRVKVYNEISAIEAGMQELVNDMNIRVRKGTVENTLIVFDEFADAFAQARKGKELDVYEEEKVMQLNGNQKIVRNFIRKDVSLEDNMRLLLQKSRSTGMHIVAATQRASAKIINGDAKVNFPVQICFRVPKSIDSKVVLDEEGAESLAGSGDGLLRSPEYLDIIRFQGFFVK
jgi:DNA segregation ATPase FtsK/SpoIIIE, S-DNA-T family